jgi:ABC-2 type transport system ATP-binding protein
MGPEANASGHTSPAVAIEHLTKRLRNGIVAVNDLNLVVESGQVLGLVGPNGSGKTITLKVLLGLVRPTSGTTRIFGELVRPGCGVLGRVGALVDGPGFVPHLSGRRNLELVARQIELTGGSADLPGAIAMTGLGDAIDRHFSGYSHGMRYRLAMAQALMGSPDLLLIDEPTTGMDPAQIHDVHSAIAICAGSGTTTIISSHQMAEVEQVCTHAAIMRSGGLVAHGTVDELVSAQSRILLRVSDIEQSLRYLQGRPGVDAAAGYGSGSVIVEGSELRPIDLLDGLQSSGIVVSEFRSRNFEDAYLDLVGGGNPGPPAPGPT